MALVICLALTAVGLVAAWSRWRRKGPRSGVRMLAWAVLPMAFYLTGLADLIERISSAFTKFGASFVFSPKTWLGVIIAGVAVLLLVVSGGLPKVPRRKGQGRQAGRLGSRGRPGPVIWPAGADHRDRPDPQAGRRPTPMTTWPTSRRSCAAAASAEHQKAEQRRQAFSRINTRPASHRHTTASPIETATPSSITTFR